ncbi:MAG: Zn-ribbon domain-containing OB-fold protein [Actinobacteria bacterium]|nr:Zn-ribbon domain-containing OB-fold protein [Actinomycetota bacterium]
MPTPDEETAPFWAGVNEDRLLIKHCNACGANHFYPRPFCPTCWSTDVEWCAASGRATLYTWSVVYNNDLPPFNERLPYVAALVDLEEGPRMMTNVVDCPFDELAAEMPLEVVYEQVSDDPFVKLPRFRPARG